MIKTVIFMMLLASTAISLLLILVQTGKIWYKKTESKEFEKTGKNRTKVFRLFLISAFMSVGIVFISQILVETPSIESESDNSISELIELEVNGREEWVSIRGNDSNNPIILFLAGGPGGTQLGAVRRNLGELEKDFVVVNWEQPGSGKSYKALPVNKITPETYIEDGTALTNYLLERFDRDKIYLMGESWGSALGIFLIEETPENYYAFIGTGQMVDFEETEKECYNLALSIAEEKNDLDKIEELKKLGLPPYYGKNMALKAAAYLQYLSSEMAHNPNIHNAGYETFADLASSEYGIMDQINFFRGVLTTFSNVYPQLYEIDLRENYSELDVPVYFFIGRHDINAPTHLAEDYYTQLQAPDKKFIWFENSGHSPWINENELFCQKTIELFTKHK